MRTDLCLLLMVAILSLSSSQISAKKQKSSSEAQTSHILSHVKNLVLRSQDTSDVRVDRDVMLTATDRPNSTTYTEPLVNDNTRLGVGLALGGLLLIIVVIFILSCPRERKNRIRYEDL